MRVLYFHQYFSTPSAPSANRSYWMAKALVEAGHEVHMVCSGSDNSSGSGLDTPFLNGKRAGTVEGFQVTEFLIEYSNHFGFLKRTFAFLKYSYYSVFLALREDCDLVFCSSTPLTAGIPGIVARWLRKRRFLFEVRDLWPELPREMGVVTNPVVLWAMSVLEWASYRSAHACIGLSPGIVKGIKKRNSTSQPVSMIPNGCDLSMFRKSETAHPIIKGIDPDDFVGIYPGAHGIANGLDAVLDAANLLERQGNKRIKFLFIGDGKLKPALQKRALDEDLGNCIFLPPIPKDQMYAYMQRANVGLMTLQDVPAFYYGTSPNKFFDYLSAGLPVLNNYPGWVADLIIEHKIGKAIAPGSPERLATALLQLDSNRQSTLEMGVKSLSLAKTQFDRSILANEFVEFLEAQLRN